MVEEIGIVLSNASTNEAKFQFRKEAENETSIFEGSLVKVECKNSNVDLLASIDSIDPYDEFFQKGGPWSEVRREGEELPEKYSSKYKVGTLKLFKNLGKGGAISNPPDPGSSVKKIDPKDNISEIFDIDEDEPTINYGNLFGYTGENAVELPLKVDKIPMHFGIFGVTGSGKSYNAGILMQKLLKIRKEELAISYPIVLIDAHGDYVGYAKEFEKNKEIFASGNVKVFVMPNQYQNLLEDYEPNTLERFGIDLNRIGARELASMVIQFRKGAGTTNELQINGLAQAIREWQEEDRDLNEIFGSRDIRNDFNEVLEDPNNDVDINTNTQRAIGRALDKFYRELEVEHSLLTSASEMREDGFVDDITTKQRFYIMDFSSEGSPGVSTNIKQMILSYLSLRLFKRFEDYSTQRETRFMIFAIEEAQNYCPSSGYEVGQTLSHSILRDIATQGRKFGLSLCMISQRPAFIDSVVLSMLNTYFIHRASPEDVSHIQRATGGLPQSIKNKLTNLGTGNVIVTGQMSGLNHPIIINVPYGERIVETAGDIKPVENIYKLERGE